MKYIRHTALSIGSASTSAPEGYHAGRDHSGAIGATVTGCATGKTPAAYADTEAPMRGADAPVTLASTIAARPTMPTLHNVTPTRIKVFTDSLLLKPHIHPAGLGMSRETAPLICISCASDQLSTYALICGPGCAKPPRSLGASLPRGDLIRHSLNAHIRAGGLVLGEGAGVHGTLAKLEGALRTPLSEAATITLATGLALAGKSVVVELVDPDEEAAEDADDVGDQDQDRQGDDSRDQARGH